MSNNTRRAKIQFITEKEYYERTDQENVTIIPCKKCSICRLAKANDWATRCYAETITNINAIFITLSYNNENLPINEKGIPTLKKEDITLFKKRIREQLFRDTKKRLNIKTFEAGEYGQKKGRPHYHMILWGYKPNDLKPLKMNKQGDWLYTSKKIEKIWGKGIVIIGNVTYESASYVARYTNKKNNEYINLEIEKPYINMSRGKNNGIGLQFWNNKKSMIKNIGGIYLKTNKGVKLKTIPKYYLKKWEEEITKKHKTELSNIMPIEMKQDHTELKNIQKETLTRIKLTKIFNENKLHEEIKYRNKKLKRLTDIKHKKWNHIINKIRIENNNWIKEIENSDLWLYKKTKKQQQIWNKKLVLSRTSLTEKEYDEQQRLFIIDRNRLLKRSLEA